MMVSSESDRTYHLEFPNNYEKQMRTKQMKLNTPRKDKQLVNTSHGKIISNEATNILNAYLLNLYQSSLNANDIFALQIL